MGLVTKALEKVKAVKLNPKMNVGKPQITTITGFVLGGRHLLTTFGSETIPQVINRIPDMTLTQLDAAFTPLLLAIFLWVFDEDGIREKVKYVITKAKNFQ
jgi:hypothetical protein